MGLFPAYSNSTISKEDEDLTPLISAVLEGDEIKVKNLLEEEVDLKARNKKGHNALHIASERGLIRIVDLLLQAGMDINKPSKDSECATPLILAAKNRHRHLVKFLLKSGANVNQKNAQTGDTPLILAAKNKNHTMAVLFLLYHALPDEENKLNRTALWYACELADETMVDLLIKHNINLVSAYAKIGILTNPFEVVREKKLTNM